MPCDERGPSSRCPYSNNGWMKARSLTLRNSMKVRPTIVAISGFSSNVGKTTLMCEVLEQLPGWEAIKLTRGHYRSCVETPRDAASATC